MYCASPVIIGSQKLNLRNKSICPSLLSTPRLEVILVRIEGADQGPWVILLILAVKENTRVCGGGGGDGGASTHKIIQVLAAM